MNIQTLYKIRSLRENMIKTAAENSGLKSNLISLANLIEETISDLEMEIFQLEIRLSGQIKSERLIISIMKQYGIDLKKALGKPDHVLIQNATMNPSFYQIPENLVKFIDWERVKNHYKEKEKAKFIEEFPHLKHQYEQIQN